MIFKKLFLAATAAAVLATPLLAMPAAAQNEQFMPLLVYRTGPYAPSGIPLANGFNDYFELINSRDGGVNGVKLTWEECETNYNNDRGVECYERLKNQGPTGATVVNPYATGITYALIERATADKIPIFSMGYGRADATIGSVFPYVFTAPATYWAGADAIIQYIQSQEKGSLKGKKIALVYHDSAYGKEPIATLEALSKQEGFTFNLFPVAHPGLEQKATWLQIGRQLRPDWVIMWGWGVMNATAIKEAAAVGYPMDKFIGIWWSGSEADVKPAGAAAKGYKSAQFTGTGTGAPVHAQIRDLLFAKNTGKGKDTFGEVLYNRGLVNAAVSVEAIRTAQGKFGNKPMTGEQMQWGFENLNITQDVIDKLGLTGLMSPIKLSCNDHEGGGSVVIQQWDGKGWNYVSDFIKPRREMLTKMYEASAMQYAKEKNITPRDCSKM
ncbi:MAG: ABC transporter substrate-binding protein [Alphaproteobacteria bacterium]|nr:ABC transporter substrate-binding protein [Alphaproteobacteria bacterium]MBU0798091.1 ABC transporter substrate-binding protein [Alphaproteobacteria bacterium]MBU0888791.1 ABC transporter substrate-binding protein [Alphaproteobacteria bacterium]MBU1812490.1 ABC transporter substrate-binding protein [Alphaproteobacteria bacterium]MBU2091349.1 ABC transporter substrate-binding protein [Alphaproteobacteria bacterium]